MTMMTERKAYKKSAEEVLQTADVMKHWANGYVRDAWDEWLYKKPITDRNSEGRG